MFGMKAQTLGNLPGSNALWQTKNLDFALGRFLLSLENLGREEREKKKKEIKPQNPKPNKQKPPTTKKK